ncbi:hypothetical protein DFS34DRAFT_187454 [Phlyctochytrium arcticum]|nr:hypothetical protein DFS34DRAFT_187454 [Phlyctochytrium arcticum]
MGLDPELQEIKSYNQQLINELQFAAEVRDYMRERADVEIDYARRLEALAKKFAHREEKIEKEQEKRSSMEHPTVASVVSSAISGAGGSPTHGDSLPVAGDALNKLPASTAREAWLDILRNVESASRAHYALHDLLQTNLADKLKQQITRKEESRKKHNMFSTRLVAERDRLYYDKDKAKSKYDEACEAVDAAKNKHGRAVDERTSEKLKRKWHEEIVDLNNTKSMYILSLAAANAGKHKYYSEDIPALLNDMLDLNQSIVSAVKDVWTTYVEELGKTLEAERTSLAIIDELIKRVDPAKDSADFAKSRSDLRIMTLMTPPDFHFSPCGLWKDTGEFATDDFTRVFLRNKLRKLSKKRDHIVEECNTKAKGVEGSKRLLETYQVNPQMGDPDDVKESMLESLRTMRSLKSSITATEAQIDTIVSLIGAETSDVRTHHLKGTTFTIPTSCDYCHGTIWGVGKPGLTCTDCGYNAHLKCELKINPECLGTREARLKRPTLSNRASSASLRTVASRSSLKSTATSLNPNWFQGASAYVLYDYTSEVPDELNVSEGMMLEVIEPDDGSGWTKVRCVVGGEPKEGLLPTSYIEVVGPAAAAESTAGSPLSRTSAPPKHTDAQARVEYDYQKANDDELTIHTGETVWIIQPDDGSGWATVTNGTQEGVVPASYISST